MRRFFLSGQTTCALLLGAGLLLRAQAALQKPDTQTTNIEVPRTRPAELGEPNVARRGGIDHAPHIARADRVLTPRVETSSQARKVLGHRIERRRLGRRGVALAHRHSQLG